MFIPASLTEDEVRLRAQALAAHSTFDGDGVLGFLHAHAIGPGQLASPLWLPVVLSKLVGSEHGAQEPHVTDLAIVASCVGDRLLQKAPIVPDERDDARWASFAAGFIAFAEIDFTWRANATSWNYALWAAALAGRADLLPALTPRQFATHVDEVQRTLRTRKASIVVLAYEDLRGTPVEQAPRGPTRTGRNDACPCGSGKKFKKCCVDKGSATPA